jgi:hypothetical protein
MSYDEVIMVDDGSSLYDQVGSIQTREDFVAFLHGLGHSLRVQPGDWGNQTLESYLEALAAWVEACDGFYANRGERVPQNPDWKFFGEILLAAKVYE